ncbi:MAG: CorA family divalent cation transporter, partial [Candidatus Saccharibacteria bacterium]|nr:CorA family divalent cation transporter [Candidatus Saccharibacteria bacterium]
MITNYYRAIRDNSVLVQDTASRGSWISVVDPTDEEIKNLEKAYNLDVDLLEDGIDLYEAPRLEREGSTIYLYTRYCRPEGEHTSTHPLLIIITSNNIISISRSNPAPYMSLIKAGNIVTTQKVKLVLEILEQVNKGYREHLNLVTKRILSTRNKLQKTIIKNTDILNFIDIEEDLNEFLAALQPYGIVLHALLNGKYIRLHERDEDLIEDLQLSTSELVELTKSRLKTIQNIREAYST